MNAQIIPFPDPLAALRPQPVRQVSIEGEYFEDEVPELFDADIIMGELGLYIRIADSRND